MISDSNKTNLFARRILGLSQLKDGFFDVVFGILDRYMKALTTGGTAVPDPGAWFTNVTVEDGASASVTFGGMYGVNGLGKYISIGDGDLRITDVPFQNTTGVTYYLSAGVYERPSGIVVNPSTGTPEYDQLSEQLGIKGNPASITDNGDGTITASLTSIIPNASDDFVGRTGYIWLAVPKGEDATTAIEKVTIATGNTITTLGSLGQSTISTTLTAYRVVIDGPIITREPQGSSAERAFIGTIIGGATPRAIDITAQPILPNLQYAAAAAAQVLAKGWLVEPTVTAVNGTGTVGWTTGTAFNAGLVRDTISGNEASLGANAQRWFALDMNTTGGAAISMFSSWDLANAGDNVPLFYIRTDGASHILEANLLGRNVSLFPEQMVLTVSSQPEHHAMFSTLLEALRWAYSLQTSTTSQVAILIDIIGTTVVAAPIASDVLLQTLRDVTIRGRNTHQPRNGQEQSVIQWNHDGSLFSFTAAASQFFQGWTFEDLTFRCTAVCTTASAAVITCAGSFNVADVSFIRCKVDGLGTGTGTGKLPGLMYLNAGSNSIITLKDCYLEVSDFVIRQTALAANLTDLIVDNVFMKPNGASPVGASQHFIMDEKGSGVNWVIRNCRASTSSEILRLDSVDQLRVVDNNFTVTGIVGALTVLTSTTNAWFIGNKLTATNSLLGLPMIAVITPGNNVHISDNIIVGNGIVAGSAGIMDLSAATPQDHIISNNNISGFETGIQITYCQRPMVANNVISGCKYGISLGTSSANSPDYGVVNGNIITCALASASQGIEAWGDYHAISANIVKAFDANASFGICSKGNSCAISGNIVQLNATNNTGYAIQSVGDYGVVCGNVAIGGDYPIAAAPGGTRATVIGNSARDGNTTNILTDSDDSVVVANNCNGAAVSDTSAGSVISNNKV